MVTPLHSSNKEHPVPFTSKEREGPLEDGVGDRLGHHIREVVGTRNESDTHIPLLHIVQNEVVLQIHVLHPLVIAWVLGDGDGPSIVLEDDGTAILARAATGSGTPTTRKPPGLTVA
jgi:hypothetical protein